MDTEHIAAGSRTTGTAEHHVIGSVIPAITTARGGIPMGIATMDSTGGRRSVTAGGQRPTVITPTGTDTTPTGITLRTTVTTRTVTTTRRTVAIPHVHTAGTSSSLTI